MSREKMGFIPNTIAIGAVVGLVFGSYCHMDDGVSEVGVSITV